MNDPETRRDDPEYWQAQYQQIAKLVGGLAHEIKNPLSTIRLNLELMAEDLGEGTPQHRRAMRKIEILQRECQRLQDLLDHFLQYVRVREYRLEACDLNAEVEGFLHLYRPQAAKAKIELTPYFEADLPRVMLDREAFRGVLFNLALNAQQAMPDGGQIVFRTRAAEGAPRLELIDTGSGMEPKILARVFEVFYSTKPAGSGLGLPTAKRMIEDLGGRMELQSEIGRGTIVVLHLAAAT